MPASLKRLTTQQEMRIKIISGMPRRLKAKKKKDLSKNLVLTWIDEVKQNYAEFKKTHLDISVREDASQDPYMVNDAYTKMLEAYDTGLCPLMQVLSELEKNEQSAEDKLLENPKVKLLESNLPTFSGNQGEWLNFQEIFFSNVHSDSSLTKTEKFLLLQSCLSGEAAAFVKNVVNPEKEYEKIWLTIEGHYFDRRSLANHYISSLFSPPECNLDSASELRDNLDKIKCTSLALEKIDMFPADCWDAFLTWRLESTFGPETKTHWETYVSLCSLVHEESQKNLDPSIPRRQYMPTFKEITKFIDTRTRVRNAPKSETVIKVEIKKESQKSHSKELVDQFICAFCKENHPLKRCPKFLSMDPRKRRRIAGGLKICFVCLGPHMAKDCPSDKSCAVCNEKHHTLLHKVLQFRDDAGVQRSRNNSASEVPDSITLD